MNIAIGSWRPNFDLGVAIETALPVEDEHRYLTGDQRRVHFAMATNYDVIVAMSLRGNPTGLIAAGFGVTREAIDKRLRPLGLKNPPGVRGRPPKPAPQDSSQSPARESASASR